MLKKSYITMSSVRCATDVTRVALPGFPALSVTVSVIVYFPGAAYVCAAGTPVPVVVSPVVPSSSATVRVTSYGPGAPYRRDAITPVSRSPSPKSQSYEVIDPSGSEEPDASKSTASPSTVYVKTATGGRFPGAEKNTRYAPSPAATRTMAVTRITRGSRLFRARSGPSGGVAMVTHPSRSEPDAGHRVRVERERGARERRRPPDPPRRSEER